MPDTITRNSGPTVPIANLRLVTGRELDRAVEHVLHPELWGEGHVVVFLPVRLPAGSITLVFPTRADAKAAVDLLSTPYSFTWAADDPADSMTFVVRPGALQPREGREGGRAWTVTVPVQVIA